MLSYAGVSLCSIASHDFASADVWPLMQTPVGNTCMLYRLSRMKLWQAAWLNAKCAPHPAPCIREDAGTDLTITTWLLYGEAAYLGHSLCSTMAQVRHRLLLLLQRPELPPVGRLRAPPVRPRDGLGQHQQGGPGAGLLARGGAPCPFADSSSSAPAQRCHAFCRPLSGWQRRVRDT